MRRCLALLLVSLFVISSLPMQAEAAGELEAVDCTGYTFEHLFEYDFAGFQIEVLDDWAQMTFAATAWVNNTNAATVRENIDGLFEGQNGGDNDWLSTDERDAVRKIGPMCIADMDSRMGLREGVPHRGEVDWNDVEFVEDGIALSETDLIPADNPQERDCQNTLASVGCREVPVTATEDLTISMSVEEGKSHNARFNQLPNKGASNFTFSLNASNMSNAQLVIEFPVMQGLRIAGFDWLEDGVVVTDHLDPQEVHLPDGSLRLIIDTSYDRHNSPPMVQELFIDLTTMAPETNDLPEWSSDAPANGFIIPIQGDSNQETAVPAATLESWANDEDGWGLNCTATNDWTTSMNSHGDFLVDIGEGNQAEITCGLVDAFGADGNETRTWNVGKLFTISGESGEKSDSAEVTITPTSLTSSFDLSIQAIQGSIAAPKEESTITQSTTITVELTGLKPGDFKINTIASGDDIISKEMTFSLGMSKQSQPPAVTIDKNLNGDEATWDQSGYSFVISGTALDSDGEAIELKAELCSATTNDFKRTGSSFEVTISIAACGGKSMETYDVTITATDESSSSTKVEISVKEPNADTTTPQPSDEDKVEASEDTPFLGAFATICTILGAALIGRRD